MGQFSSIVSEAHAHEIIDQRDNQHRRSNEQDIDSHFLKDKDGQHTSREEAGDDGHAQINTPGEGGGVFFFRVVDQLRQFDTEVGEQSCEVRGANGSFRNLRDECVLQSHGEQQHPGNPLWARDAIRIEYRHGQQ